MDTALKSKVLRTIIHQLVNTKFSKEKIIDNAVKSTYLTKPEVRAIYVEALDVLIGIVRQAKADKDEKEKKRKKHN